MKLTNLLAGSGAERLGGDDTEVEVTGVAHDSRLVKPGDLFIALPGAKADGGAFAQEAVRRGAVALVAERALEAKVPRYKVGSARKALARIAAKFYREPAAELTLLAVTGTNGKTTTTHLLESICSAGRASTGLVGTIHHRFAGQTVKATHTTPDALELHRLFREMVDAGTEWVVMEVSSHALVQERVHGLVFRAAAFTNLTRDHLDYHRDLEDYFQSKRRLFLENLSPTGVAVVNGDDTYATRIYSELRGAKRMAWKFSRHRNGELSAEDVELSVSGIRATLKTPAGDIAVQSKLVGSYNLENILAAAGMALGAGFSRRDVQEGINRVARIPGRMERFEKDGLIALVDYAHSDEALRRALETCKSLAKGRVFVVFGCGGDRDKGKRPLMGIAAAELADIACITSDNPRSEDPDEIIEQIVAGIEKAGARRISLGKAKAGEKGYLVEPERRTAIELVVGLAKAGDVILLAGKGHETDQQVGGNRHPFDDREEAARALKVSRGEGDGRPFFS